MGILLTLLSDVVYVVPARAISAYQRVQRTPRLASWATKKYGIMTIGIDGKLRRASRRKKMQSRGGACFRRSARNISKLASV